MRVLPGCLGEPGGAGGRGAAWRAHWVPARHVARKEAEGRGSGKGQRPGEERGQGSGEGRKEEAEGEGGPCVWRSGARGWAPEVEREGGASPVQLPGKARRDPAPVAAPSGSMHRG